MIGDVDQFPTIGREIILQRSAELKRRCVVFAGSHISRLSGRSVCNKRVSAGPILPGCPMTIEKRVRAVRLQRRVGLEDFDGFVRELEVRAARQDVELPQSIPRSHAIGDRVHVVPDADLRTGHLYVRDLLWGPGFILDAPIPSPTYFTATKLAKLGVKPGGVLIARVLLENSAEPGGRFRAKPGELRSYFEDWEILHSAETESGPHRVAEIAVLRKRGMICGTSR